MSNTQKKSKKNTRPPVVVVLGHVDHGKTTLLDTIRKTNVVARESGGITQHIGAYQVEVGGSLMTFLDTPGHQAFSATREHGAKIADIAIVIIAADDSLQPQTKDALKIVQAEKIPFFIAINKTDLPGADADKVLTDLAQLGIQTEAWGGDVPSASISALKGEGIDELLELVALVGEMSELTSDSSSTDAVVIESKRDERAGNVVTLLIRNGTLKPKDSLYTDKLLGSVRVLKDEHNATVTEAPPSKPVVVSGFTDLPARGSVVNFSSIRPSAKELNGVSVASADLVFPMFIGAETPQDEEKDADLVFLLKADVQGSIPALVQILKNYDWKSLRVKIVQGEIGVIKENDVSMANIAQASIIGFKVRISPQISAQAERLGVSVHLLDVIYTLDDVVEKIIESNLKSSEAEVVIVGELDIKKVFHTEPIQDDEYAIRSVIGGKVTSGSFPANACAYIMRNDKRRGEVRIESLQSDRKDVPQVGEGAMFGAEVHNTANIQEGDTLAVFVPED